MTDGADDTSKGRGEAACGGALALAGLALSLGARGMAMWDDGVPGPGLAPLILGLALAAMGAGIAYAALRRPTQTGRALLDRDTLVAVGLLTAAVAALELLGYIGTAFLFLLAFITVVGREPFWRAALVAGGATLVTWALFVKALGVALPAGMLSWM